MLLANRKVAEFVGRKRKGVQNSDRTFVYRIHDKPNTDKMAQFRSFVTRFGYQMKAQGNKAVAKEINRLMKKIHGRKEREHHFDVGDPFDGQSDLFDRQYRALRAGVRLLYAFYFADPSLSGYDGAPFARALPGRLGKSEDKEVLRTPVRAFVGDGGACRRCRTGLDQVQNGRIHARQARSGVRRPYSGITEWGIYVELEDTKIEGMVALRDADRRFLRVRRGGNYAVRGREHKRTFTLGDEVRIRVTRADLQRKQLDFDLVASYDFGTKRRFGSNNGAGRRAVPGNGTQRKRRSDISGRLYELLSGFSRSSVRFSGEVNGPRPSSSPIPQSAISATLSRAAFSHATDDRFAHFVFFAFQQVDDRFVVYLRDDARQQSAFAQLAVYGDHRQFHDVGRAAWIGR